MVDTTRRAVVFGGLFGAISGCGSLAQSRRSRPSLPDTVVTSTDELEAAFAEASPGESIYVTDENAPYRTTQWLDIDQDGVTVAGPGVEELLKPADRANVGGIRIGHHSACENVVVSGIGYHGNPENQRRGAHRRHGIIVRNASNVTLQGNLLTKTHPYHHHNWGGSGISAEQQSSNVRILGNRIYDIGDRGIQLAGTNIVVAGNVVTDGFDRSVSCDAWAPDGSDHHARNVTIFGNVLADNAEGSLTGIGGTPPGSDRGYITVSHNVGSGAHKSFCHVGGRGAIQNFTIEGNVSIQDESKPHSGIEADIHSATNLTVSNNHLYDYGDHGILLGPGVSDFSVSNNSVFNPKNAGIRASAASDGAIQSNYVKNARPGIILDGAERITVAGNRIRKVAIAGVLSRSGTPTNHEIRDNYIDNRDTEWHPPAILVGDSGNTVRGNYVVQKGPPAIKEETGAENNVYAGNQANGNSPWRITAGNSTVRNHTPPFDVHRDVTDDDSSGQVSVTFEKPYSVRPRLTFGRVGGGIEGISYRTGSNENFTGVSVSISDPGGTIDLFVQN